MHNAVQALRAEDYRSLGLSGGVANNRNLRARFTELAHKQSVPLFMSEPRHSGDNASMIAFASFAEEQPGTARDAQTHIPLLPSLRITESP